ncbi:hypothetical protein HDU96_009072 [Phlyctochytrium bullatum]|nr:hypothetical protein HDU96_009072 [Phlyctochytrium bullatum]
MDVYLGLPFAKPPLGPLRWRPPIPHPGPIDLSLPLTTTLSAHRRTFSPVPLTPPLTIGSKSFFRANPLTPHLINLDDTFHTDCYGPQPDPMVSEDCLYLNVWVPTGAGKEENGDGGKAVLVVVPGGAFVSCWTSSPLFDPQTICRNENIIVVTLSYRTGYFGFALPPSSTPPPDATNPTTPNLGLLDILTALRWVKHNISAFGGSPSRLTLLGESAGSIAVHHLLTSPSVEPSLFARAALHSGVQASTPAHTPAFAAQQWAVLASALGDTDPRDASAEQILEGTFISGCDTWGDVHDHLKRFPADMAADIVKVYGALPPPSDESSDAAFDYAAQYIGDLSFNLPVQHVLHHLSLARPAPPLYAYHFRHIPPYPTATPIFGLPFRRAKSAHTLEEYYVLGCPCLGAELPGEEVLAGRLGALWGRFVRGGKPWEEVGEKGVGLVVGDGVGGVGGEGVEVGVRELKGVVRGEEREEVARRWWMRWFYGEEVLERLKRGEWREV